MRVSRFFRSAIWLFFILLLPGILFAADQKKMEKGGPAPSSGIILRPDLVVDRIWLDSRCAVNFTIRNAGPGVIGESEHARGMVRVLIGKAQKDYPFKVVDSGNDLKKPGKSISFNTQVILEDPAQVKVTVDADGVIPETHEGNNSRQEQLTPGCKKEAPLGAPTRSTPETSQPQATQPKMGTAQRPTAGPAATMDPGGMPSRMQAPPRAGLPAAKEDIHVPIDVFEPRAGALLHQGGEITVRWVVNPGTPANVVRHSQFVVDLYEENSPHDWHSLYSGQYRVVTATVPAGIPDSDRYIIKVWGWAYEPGGIRYLFEGYSHRFRIGRANGIVLVHPPERSPTTMDLNMGRIYEIEWNCTGTFADPVDVKVLTADGVNRDNLALRLPCANRRLTWQVGRGWTGLHSADGLYRIRVESSLDRNIKAESAIFRINPAVFAISSPAGGVSWRRYSRQTISWTGGDGATRLRVALFKGGEHYSDIVRNLHPSFRSLDWLVSYGYTDYATLGGGLTGAPLATGTMGGVVLPAGSDYQIKISLEGSPSEYAMSGFFTIREP